MKITKTLPIAALLFAVLLTACTQTKKDSSLNEPAISVTDTLGFAEFQRWKMESEIRERIRIENEMAAAAAPARSYTPAKSSSAKKSYATSSRRSGNTRYASGNRNYSSNGGYATTSRQQQPARKKWSHTAKGAVVGGASGAIIGAVANRKNRLGGGVVGAVVGAATGAGIGAIVDKKERQRQYYYY